MTALPHKRVRRSPRPRMQVFDALPKEIRQALANAGENISPYEARKLLRDRGGWSLMRTIKNIGGTTPQRRVTGNRAGSGRWSSQVAARYVQASAASGRPQSADRTPAQTPDATSRAASPSEQER